MAIHKARLPAWFRALLAFPSVLLIAVALNADTRKADSRLDGFVGPVRSVTTRQELAKVDVPAEGRPIWVSPAICPLCEYDRMGNRTRMGAEITRLVKNENDNVLEKTFETPEGDVTRHELWGPFGILEQISYGKGKLISHSIWSYDANGHLAEFHGYDQDGVQIASSHAVNGKLDHNREVWDYGKDGVFQLHFVETNEPKTEYWTFANLNEDGSVKASVKTLGNSVLFYQQDMTEANVFGSGFYMDPENKKQVSYRCHPDSTCDQIASDCQDEECRLVTHVEWRDATGTSKLLIEYEYELDSWGNWTKRVAWVSGAGLPERTLAETDYRELQYWSN
jgi:hypothetical protein